MAKLIELRPRKDLMNPNFEGYKLSLDPLPVYKHDLPSAVENLKPNSEQYSFQHMKTFGLHNHLITDPWHSDFTYFISGNLSIFQVHVHSLTSQNPEFKPVWKIPVDQENRNGFFNASLSFAGPNLAVIADGGGILHIVDTNQRETPASPNQWEVKHSSNVLKGMKPFVILHSVLNLAENGDILNLNVLLLRIEPIDQVETQVALSTLGCNENETPFIPLLDFLVFNLNDGQWSLNQLKRIAVPQGVEYASILNPAKSLCIIAREPLGIIYDSLTPLATAPKSEDTTELAGEPKYTWAESEDDVTVWMSFAKHTSKHDLVVECKPQFLKVIYKKEVALEGELAHSVSSESSLWTLSDGKLEIVLPKVDKSVFWNHLILNDSRGQKVLDTEAATEWHQRMIHLTSEEMEMQSGTLGSRHTILSNEQLEECDDTSMEELYLFRFSGETNEITHKAMLGGHQFLLTTPSAPSLAPAFCLRHDVDGLIWQPMGDEMDSSWRCLHTATLQALGYIQASKEQRKFTVCSPSMSYVAICDAFHHVFIYRQPGFASTGVEMVHRPTGRRVGTVARQQVLSLESPEECLGVVATDAFLLVLMSSSMIAIRVNSD